MTRHKSTQEIPNKTVYNSECMQIHRTDQTVRMLTTFVRLVKQCRLYYEYKCENSSKGRLKRDLLH